jgi:hypothetical protein
MKRTEDATPGRPLPWTKFKVVRPSNQGHRMPLKDFKFRRPVEKYRRFNSAWDLNAKRRRGQKKHATLHGTASILRRTSRAGGHVKSIRRILP